VRAETVLDGAYAAADALHADEIVIAIDQQMTRAVDAVTRAVKARHDLNHKGLRTTVQTVPSGYTTGQETALISWLSGGEAKPTSSPPYPFERGLRGHPTLVCNTETYSHIGRVAKGSYDGSRLVTVAGAVARPGLVEATSATTLAGLVRSTGGLTEPVQGVLLGGYAGTWTKAADLVRLQLDEHLLREHDLTLGAGIVFLLGDSQCPVAEVARVAKWMAGQSARQCGPCINGLSAIATALQELASVGDQSATYGRIRTWSELVQRRGACGHPDGVARFVTTALDVFTPQFDDHAHHGACDRCAVSSALPIPRRRQTQTQSGASSQPRALALYGAKR
jgi:NADH:ubiquinone oxidoreductase subunit F (NADH-binding)